MDLDHRMSDPVTDVEFLRAAAPRLREARPVRNWPGLVQEWHALADLIDGALTDYIFACDRFNTRQITGAEMAMPVWQGMFKRLATYVRSVLGETP